MSHNDSIILNHYKKVAQHFGDTDRSTMQDPRIRQGERDFIEGEIEHFLKLHKKTNCRIWDVGCGNGNLLAGLSERFPTSTLAGLEFTPELCQIAQNRQIPNCKILQGDIRDASCLQEADLIITERVIINILKKKEQAIALKNIASALPLGGRYILVESFRETLMNLNKARREFNFEELTPSYQNKYMDEQAIPLLRSLGMIEIPGQMPRHYLSTHFFITRVFHKAIRPEGGKMKETEFEKFMGQALPPAVGEYSPIQFRVFEKIS